MSDKINHGEAIRCYREFSGMKQEALAEKLGDDWTQKKISLLESKETIEPEIMEQVAKALGVSADAIKNFDKESAIRVINNYFNDQSVNNGAVGNNSNHHCNFNPLDKFIEAMEDNKKLYERLLQAEKEKVEMLERLLGK